MHGMMQAVQHAARAQEEQGLEESMREEVEHAGARAIDVACYTQTNEHVSQLADRRESQHALEIGLRDRDQRGKARWDSTDPGYNLEIRRVGSCNHQEHPEPH